MMPGQAADREHRDEAEREAAAASGSRSEPPQSVAIQLKILMPVGIAMSIVGEREGRVGDRAHADGEHVVRPDAEAQEADEDARRRPSTGSRRAACRAKVGSTSETIPKAGRMRM